MRELGRRSGEARRRKREQRAAGELELTDREQAKVALRRALDGNNMAAMVAAAKALIEFDRTDPRTGLMSVEDAREQLEARLNVIEDRRRRHGQVCPTCSGSGIVARASRGGEGPGLSGEGWISRADRGPREGERPSPYTVNV
jgi:hypothetical protein